MTLSQVDYVTQAWRDRGCDPTNEFIRHLVAAGITPLEAPTAHDWRDMLELCPIASDVPFPGHVPALPLSHDRRSFVDAKGYRADTKFPFQWMAVGQSFSVHPSLDPQSLRSAAHKFGRDHDMTFRFRRGRCWRTR